MSKQREELIPDRIPVHQWHWLPDPSTPVNAMQALMETAPGEEPRRTLEDDALLREAVADCFTALHEEARFILNATLYERVTVRDLAKRLGLKKSHTHRLTQAAVDRLGQLLRSHPAIQERHPALKANDWNQAAEDAVNLLHIESQTTLPIPFDEGISRGKELLHDGWDNIPELREVLVAIGATAYGELLDRGEENQVLDILVDRHRKYGPGNIAEFLEVGLLVRMSDKVARIKNGTGDFADDAFIDAYIDLVGYAAICLMLEADTFFLPLAEADSAT